MVAGVVLVLMLLAVTALPLWQWRTGALTDRGPLPDAAPLIPVSEADDALRRSLSTAPRAAAARRGRRRPAA